jgi:hypothetical protein
MPHWNLYPPVLATCLDLGPLVPSLGIPTIQRHGETSPSVRRCIPHLVCRLNIRYHIDLMSGSNLNMSLVTPVATHLDGTNPSLSPFHWRCPDVTPNAAIYFYQVWCTTTMWTFELI